jgi:lipid-binding SYLF domain-containing protein
MKELRNKWTTLSSSQVAAGRRGREARAAVQANQISTNEDQK